MGWPAIAAKISTADYFFDYKIQSSIFSLNLKSVSEDIRTISPFYSFLSRSQPDSRWRAGNTVAVKARYCPARETSEHALCGVLSSFDAYEGVGGNPESPPENRH